jgi:hypothetical protein
MRLHFPIHQVKLMKVCEDFEVLVGHEC